MSGQVTAAEKRVKLLKARLAKVQLALEKLSNGSSTTKVELPAKMSNAKESLREAKTRIERLERKLATEFEKWRHFVAERRITS